LFTRHLDLKLLAPAALLSLLLVAVCLFGTLYLNQLHLGVADELTENVRSTVTAAQLEGTTQGLLRLLRNEHLRPRALADQVRAENVIARDLLAQAQTLANLPREKELVQRLTAGLTHYLDGWEQREGDPAPKSHERDLALADVLEKEVIAPCSELRRYNLGEIDRSNRSNQTIVTRLRWGMLAVGLCGPVCGLMLGYAVARRFWHSIAQLSVHVRDAAGRLNRELGSVTVARDGDLTRLHEQMQMVLQEISRVVEQLQQREYEVLRAEQLAAVGQVAAGVAHELRNPLTAIKLLAQTGLEGSPPAGLPAEDLEVVEQEVRRMEQCIQTFLDFARPPRSERRPADLTQVVRRALTLAEGRAHRQKVTLSSEGLEGPLAVALDPEQIQQVLLNLLLNALDALPRGGTIQVAVRRQPAAVEVQVQDSGPGIAPQILARLFEPFVTSKENGLGLGLSICRRLVEAHGGTIRGANAPTGGAVFTVALPA
jgi:two-component system sensor histidine kinase HydH